jgi:RimJ/RimL family protein N-acetyltransferase
VTSQLILVEWQTPDVRLRIVEPTTDEVREHAGTLADFYNEPVNRALLTNEHEFCSDDVVEQFAEMFEEGGHPFLLFADETMVGDCDLRHIEGKTAEFAVLVGARARQARGLGTRFTTMAHVIAFGPLALERVFVSVRPENAGSLRMLGKVGYVVDTSPAARRFAEEEDDVCMSLAAAAFARAQGSAAEGMRVTTRDPRAE